MSGRMLLRLLWDGGGLLFGFLVGSDVVQEGGMVEEAVFERVSWRERDEVSNPQRMSNSNAYDSGLLVFVMNCGLRLVSHGALFLGKKQRSG